MKLLGALNTVLLLSLLCLPLFGLSQRTIPLSKEELEPNGTYVIPSGKTRTLTSDTPRIERLLIQGTLVVNDTEDVALHVGQMHLEGGTLRAGDTDHPFQHRFSISLGAQKKGGSSFLKVSKGGRVLLHGIHTDIPNTLKDTTDIKQTISIGVENEQQEAAILIESAATIQISGVHLQGLGSQDTPAISWHGKTAGPAHISHSIFSGSKHTDLYLDKTEVLIENNLFISRNGSSITCSPSGIGINNRIVRNTIYNTNNKGKFALRLLNPYQYVSNNTLYVKGNSNGIGILSPKGYESFKWKKDPKLFNLLENHIESLSEKPSSSTVGLRIDAFEHTGIWRSHRNTITNFHLGLITKSKNTIIDGYVLENNLIGIIPGVSYIQNCHLTNEQEHPESIGIWATNEDIGSAPKILNINIANYPTGFQIENHVAQPNYFEKITYENVTTPLKFKNLSSESVLYDKDRSLSQIPLPKTDLEPEPVIAGHHHGSKKGKHKGLYIFHSTSALNTKESTPLSSDAMIFTAPVANFGTLTIATGFGLEDPVHEHYQQLNTVLLKHSETNRIWAKEEALDTEAFFLPANGIYEFEYQQSNAPLYDLSFEWEAPEDSWIIIKFKYPYPTIKGLRSFGSLIQPTTSMHGLMHQNETSYYFEPSSETVFAKIYNHSNRDELVIYSSDILTEIKVNGKKVPLSIYSDIKNDKIIIAYNLPTTATSTLVLTDQYGNTLETLHDGTSDAGKVSKEFSLRKHDVRTGVYLYFLTVGEQTHKGPVYAY